MPDLHARPGRRLSAALCAAVALSVALTGCSSEDGGDPAGRAGDGATATSAPRVELRTSVTRVHGDLSKEGRDHLVHQAGELITGYLEAAYFHQRSGSGYRGSFPGFTHGARRLALGDTRVASDRALAGATEVTPKGAVAFLSVVAKNGHPVGATARLMVKMAVEQGDATRWKQVTGRLLLTPGAHQWRIFGYDLAMGAAAPAKGGKGR